MGMTKTDFITVVCIIAVGFFLGFYIPYLVVPPPLSPESIEISRLKSNIEELKYKTEIELGRQSAKLDHLADVVIGLQQRTPIKWKK